MQLVDFHNLNEIQSDAVRQCIEFACKHNLQAVPIGRHDIDGHDIYVVINEYQTMQSQDKAWEAHREYIDLQMVIQGEEIVEITPLKDMQLGEYVAQNDFLPCDGNAAQKIHLKKDEGLILFPEDAHKPGVLYEKEAEVRKAVFKIHCSRWR